MDKPARPKFGKLQEDAINDKLLPATPAPVPSGDGLGLLTEKVQLTTRCQRGTYLALKEAKYWAPGFVEEEFIEAAILSALAALPAEHRQPLPPARLAQLLKTNKKLKG